MNKAELELERRRQYQRDASNATNARKKERKLKQKSAWVHKTRIKEFDALKEQWLEPKE